MFWLKLLLTWQETKTRGTRTVGEDRLIGVVSPIN